MTAIMKQRNAVGLLALLAAAIAFPFVFSDPTTTTIALFALIYACAATGWNIFSGYTGYIALGHAAYFGVGAYSLAIICNNSKIPGGYLPLFLVPVCGLIAGVFAIPLGAIALRTRRHTFVVVTVATFFIMQLLAYNLRGLTNGSTGLDMPIPLQWNGVWGGAFYNVPFYFTALIATLLALAVSWFVRNSKFGLGLLAIRDDEDRARGLGVKTSSSKLIAFVISAIFTGMGGAIFAYYLGHVTPQFTFEALFDVAIALMVFMGGLGTLTGPILGALVLESAQQILTVNFPSAGLYLILYGVLFLVVILLLPQGIVPSLRTLWNKWQMSRQAPLNAPPAASQESRSLTPKAEEATA